MLLKKKKILNVKYKRKHDSARLLDKQFSITDRSHFKINIKGINYYFQKTKDVEVYSVRTEADKKSKKITLGGNVNIKHKDGTNIFFDFYEDFLYDFDHGMYSYVGLSLALSVLLAIGISLMPKMGSEPKILSKKEKTIIEDQKRLKDLLTKLEKKEKKVVAEVKKPDPPKPKPVPPKPKPTPPKPKKVVKKQPPKVKKKSQLLSQKPKSTGTKKGRVKVVNDKRKMKRLVVQKGPPRRGGTGPRNPNAAKNSARRSQAVKLAQTKAKVASSLNFLAKGKGSFNIPPGTKGGRGFATGGGGGLAGTKNVKGKNFLAKVTGKNVIGSSNGAINTKGSRVIASGAVVSDGEINGVAGGKSLNYVQGKVSVSGLHAAGGSGGFSQNFGAQKMAVKGNISQSLIRKVIQKNMGKFVYCYEKSMLRNPSLTGVVSITWTIRPGGRAMGSRVTKSQLNDNSLHGCLTGVMNKLNFAPGPKGGAAVVTYPFNFTSSML